jgi:uncharacterized protein Usg
MGKILVLPRPVLVTVDIIYHRFDYPSLLQEFVLQIDDGYPDFLKTRRFLDHWHREVRAVIAHLDIKTDGPF